MNRKVSLIIRCYNEEQHIGRLLSGVMQQTIADDVEIILVDSGSTDATVSIASRYPVHVVSIRPEEFSFGYSLNRGCREATGEFLVMASAHVYPVYADWLERLLAPFADPDIALVYGRQIGNEQTKYSEHQVFARWFPEQSQRYQDTPFCNNANAAVRRSVWEQLPYDETLTGLEDIDWAQRAMQQGYKVAYAADAEIVHVHDETPKRIYNRYRREAIALKRIFPHEQFRLRDFIRLFSANVINDYVHAWRDRVLRRNLRDIFVFRLMQFWGTYRGFAQGSVTSQLKQTFYYPGGRGQTAIREQYTRERQRIDYSSMPEEEIHDTIG
jgi:glycosyltransferase involved in cell wall biosynthesis